MEENKKEMTAEELEYAEFQAYKAQKQASERAKVDRERYRTMVDDEIAAAIPALQELSGDIKTVKKTVLSNFKAILDMKAEMLTIIRDDQRSHTFTNSDGNMRITLGVHVTDGWRDTVEDGIAIVREHLEALGSDEKTRGIVKMVFKLLAKDTKGTLKASRVLQLKKLAEDDTSERFKEGVKIIEESYMPAISKQYIRAECKGVNGEWVVIPLGMTES